MAPSQSAHRGDVARLKLLVVADNDGNIKAAAKMDPDNEFSPIGIEVKPGSGESLHEITIPEQLQDQGLDTLVDYYVVADPEPRLLKRS